jgi:hypothetical protein
MGLEFEDYVLRLFLALLIADEALQLPLVRG